MRAIAGPRPLEPEEEEEEETDAEAALREWLATDGDGQLRRMLMKVRTQPCTSVYDRLRTHIQSHINKVLCSAYLRGRGPPCAAHNAPTCS